MLVLASPQRLTPLRQPEVDSDGNPSALRAIAGNRNALRSLNPVHTFY